MSDKEWLTSIGIFLFAMFFSASSWINRRAKSGTYVEGKTPARVKVEGITHSLTGGLISVVLFAIASHFKPEWGLLLQGSVAVASGALLGETLIIFAERRINNDKLI